MYTPFLVVVALGWELVGATPCRALQLAGIVNLCLLAHGICFLFSRVSVHRRWSLPAACFLTTLFLRWLHFGWSLGTSPVNLQYLVPRRQLGLLKALTSSFGEPAYRGDAYAVFDVTR